MGKKKRPVLKIVLIVLGAIVIIAVITNIAGGGDSSSSPETTVATTTNVESGEVVAAPEAPPEKKSSPQYVKAGMYKVGSELPAGEYIIEATGDMAYYQVSSDSSGEIDSIIVNDTFNKGVFAYIILQDGDYIKVDRGRMITASELTLKPKLDAIPPSTYKVGKDIPAGEYKLTPTDEIAYWERSKNPRDSINGIIANDVVTESVYVTVRDGEYFKITGVQGQKVN